MSFLRSFRWIMFAGMLGLIPRTGRGADAEDPKAKASQLIKSGNELYEKREYEAALGLFERAVAVYPSPMIYFNIARAHQVLGNLVQAASYYEKFLAESGVREASERYELAAEGLREVDARLGKIAVRGAREGTEIEVDGAPIAGAAAGGAFRAAPGDHEVVARLTGFIPFRAKVTVEAGATAQVDVQLTEAPPVKVAEPAGPRLPKVEPAAPAAAVVDVAPREESSSIAGKWWFWTLVGAVVVAGAGVAIVATSGGEFSRPGELDGSSTKDWNSL